MAMKNVTFPGNPPSVKRSPVRTSVNGIDRNPGSLAVPLGGSADSPEPPQERKHE